MSECTDEAMETADSGQMRVLRLNKAGMPLGWLSRKGAAQLVVKDQVLWSMGDYVFTMYGGYDRQGRQSVLKLPSILATDGELKKPVYAPPKVCNRILFRRDQNICLYCGNQFSDMFLTRDHILAKSRGGQDTWTNLVTACRRCNQRKGHRTPEESNMPLLAVPFVPNHMEMLVLANRNILIDQMAFLKTGFSKNMRSN